MKKRAGLLQRQPGAARYPDPERDAVRGRRRVPQKSEAKMREIITDEATTILVFHSLAQMRQMCTKILWLHKGKQVEFGDDVNAICDRYQEFLEEKIKL